MRGKIKASDRIPRTENRIFGQCVTIYANLKYGQLSFIIRTLPSVKESHLVGSIVTNALRRLYCRYGITLLKHSRTVRKDRPYSHYSLFLRIRCAKNDY